MQGQSTSSRLVSRSQCSSPGATGISGLHSRRTRGDRHSSRVESKNPALLLSRDGYLLELTGGLKGVKPPEAFGERSRAWPLGHAGDEGPHLPDDGGVSGWFSSGGPSVRFLARYDGEVSESLVGRQGSRVSM